jgi:hypothetical protein
LTDHVLNDWVYKLGGDMLGPYKFNSDGTYSYSSMMFNINGVKGEW